MKYIVDTMFQELKYYPVKFTERANMRLSFTWSNAKDGCRDYMLCKMFSQFLWPGASEKSIYFQVFVLELKKSTFISFPNFSSLTVDILVSLLDCWVISHIFEQAFVLMTYMFDNMITTLKFLAHFSWSRNLITYQYAINYNSSTLISKTLENTWVLKTI